MDTKESHFQNDKFSLSFGILTLIVVVYRNGKIRLAVQMLDVQIPDVLKVFVLYKKGTTYNISIILVILWIHLFS